MPNKDKSASPEDEHVQIRWEADVADHDYAAAQAYLH